MKSLFKRAFRKAKSVFLPTRNRSLNSSLEKDENGFFFQNYNNYRIYSKSIECIQGGYKILNKNIYDFQSKSLTPFIIDGGANIGLGVLFWKEKFPQSEIIAFEPSKEVFQSLIKNVEFNNLSGVTCINKGLSNKEGQAAFTANEGVSGSVIIEKGLDKEYLIETTRLSNYMTREIDFLKLDIEGAEKYVIPEIADKLHLVNNLFIEYHSFIHEEQYLSYILKLLEENNFRYYLEGEYSHAAPLAKEHISLKQDLQVSIWAKRNYMQTKGSEH